jgi:alkanesulfonate monooxygenase SsuD/methylene tetrahydromethanopterin reductase-like flavin-dependent oxidoreductase (luciferase family)
MADTLRFGISLPNRGVLFGMSPNVLLETAEQADQSGLFDGVWVGDNLLSKPRLEAIVTLSAIAARTKRVRLGTICFASFPMRHPLIVALQSASIDVLSGGRYMMSACNGGGSSKGPQFAAELAAMNIKSKERVERVEEGIEILRLLWGDELVTYHGKYYTLDNVDLQPKPVQKQIPLTIAVNPAPDADPAIVENAMRRVARLSNGWQSDGTPPEVFRKRWNMVRQFAAEYGRADDVTDSVLHLMVNINDDAAAAKREAVDFLDHYYGAGGVSPEKLDSWLAFGSPQAVIEKIQAFVDAGVNTPVLRFVSPDQHGQLERCIREVLPAFQNQIVVTEAAR